MPTVEEIRTENTRLVSDRLGPVGVVLLDLIRRVDGAPSDPDINQLLKGALDLPVAAVPAPEAGPRPMPSLNEEGMLHYERYRNEIMLRGYTPRDASLLAARAMETLWRSGKMPDAYYDSAPVVPEEGSVQAPRAAKVRKPPSKAQLAALKAGREGKAQQPAVAEAEAPPRRVRQRDLTLREAITGVE